MTTEDSGEVGGQGTLVGEKRCFIVCPIGAKGSAERKRSDAIKRHVIDKAIVPMGYKTVRADEVDQSGSITTQIVSNLIEADLVIADLTDQNPNVFYELAIRHAFKKPYIQIIEDGQDIPFDVKSYRTVFIDHHDLDSAEDARASIENMVKEIEGGSETDSPVSHAVTRQDLGASADPAKQEIGLMADAIDEMRRDMSLIARRTHRPIPDQFQSEYAAMREVIESLASRSMLSASERNALLNTSMPRSAFARWVQSLPDPEPPF